MMEHRGKNFLGRLPNNMSDRSLSKKIDDLIRTVEKIAVPIPAIPAIPAIQPIAPIPAIPPITLVPSGMDHDIMTGLVKDVANLDKKVDSLSVKLDTKYTTTEEHTLVVGIQSDHETRIRENTSKITQVMAWGSALIVFIGILEFLISKFLIK